MQCTGIHCWIVWQLLIIRNTRYIQVSMFSVFDFGTAALQQLDYTMFVYPAVVDLIIKVHNRCLFNLFIDIFIFFITLSHKNFLLKNVSTNFLYISSSIQKQSKNMSKTMRYLNDNWHGIIYYLKKTNCIDFYVQYLQSKKKDDKRF